MKYIIYLALSLIVILVVGALLLWQLPANFLAAQVEEWCKAQCRLTDTSGTIWQGNGNLFVKENQHSQWLNIGKLTWQSDFSQILNQRILLNFQVDNGKVDITLTTKTIEAKMTQLRMPAAMFLGRLGDGMPISGWGGWFVMQDGVSKLTYDGKESSHNLNFFWKQAKAQVFQDEILGDYQITGVLNNGNGQLNLKTISGSLQLNGTANLAGNFSFSGQASAQADSALEAALKRIGQGQNPDGSFNIRIPH